jgi:hypothetical protein
MLPCHPERRGTFIVPGINVGATGNEKPRHFHVAVEACYVQGGHASPCSPFQIGPAGEKQLSHLFALGGVQWGGVILFCTLDICAFRDEKPGKLPVYRNASRRPGEFKALKNYTPRAHSKCNVIEIAPIQDPAIAEFITGSPWR